MLCDDLDGYDGEGEREIQEGGDICMHMAISLNWTSETNTMLKSNYIYI